MHLTKHCTKRAQQRGIRQNLIELLLEFGSRRRRPGGAFSISADKKALRRIRRSFTGDRQLVEKIKGEVLICSEDNQIITCYHQRK